MTQGSQVSESHVYITWSDNRTRDSPVVIGGRTLSWTSFAFDEAAVSVQVHTPRDFSTCLIRPRGYGYSCTRSGPQVQEIQDCDPTLTAQTNIVFLVEYLLHILSLLAIRHCPSLSPSLSFFLSLFCSLLSFLFSTPLLYFVSFTRYHPHFSLSQILCTFLQKVRSSTSSLFQCLIFFLSLFGSRLLSFKSSGIPL